MADKPAGSEHHLRDIEQLRQLLMAEERRKIEELESYLDDPRALARRIGAILPDAVQLSRTDGDRLARELAPTVQKILTETVKKDPRPLIAVLSPVIGAAIRRSVSESLQRMIQSLNQILEHGFSLRGLKWRIEALRTGKPFSEIVLLHSLVFTVEQVFLIHRDSGLLLRHLTAEKVDEQSGDTVSAMLTAIQDFINDSFNRSGSGELSSVRLGELTLIIEQGPHAVIAGVVRGIVPPELPQVFRQAIDDIHRRLGPELQRFDGDTAPFDAAMPDLEACRRSCYRRPATKPSPALVLIAAALLVTAGVWIYGHVRSEQQWKRYLEALDGQPGLVVTDARREEGKYVVEGLRDPLAPDPGQLLTGTGIKPDHVVGHWEPVYILSDAFTLRRARQVLQPPSSVILQVNDGRLSAKGDASHAWVTAAHRNAPLIAGVKSFDASGLRDLDEKRLKQLVSEVGKYTISFSIGSDNVDIGQETTLRQLAAAVGRLQHQARILGKRIRVVLTGYADPSGPADLNRRLIRRRTIAVRRSLTRLGVDPGLLETNAGSIPEAQTARLGQQRPQVGVTVRLRDDRTPFEASFRQPPVPTIP